MRKILLLFLCFFLFQFVNGQVCNEIKNYAESIDTTERPVYLVVDKMPEIFDSINLMNLFRDSKILKELECCPIRIWFAFTVESDSTLSNVRACANMVNCNDSLIQSETILLNDRVETLLKNTKSKPGILNGEKVAVYCISYIHYECME